MKYFSKTIILISVVFIFIFGVSFAKAENVSASTTTDIISAIQQQIYNLKVQLLQLQIADLQRQFLAAASDSTSPAPATSPTPPAANNPAPVITSISPSSVNVGDSFSLSVYGSNFVLGTKLILDNHEIQITSLATNQIYVSNMSPFSSAGSHSITVQNPDGQTANSTLTVIVPVSTTPTITNMSPPSKTVYQTDFTLTINGTNFTPNSVVEFGRPSYDNKGNYLGINFQPRTTNFTLVSPQQVTITISHTDLDTSGPWDVRVRNGQAVSNVVEFVVNTLPAPHIDQIIQLPGPSSVGIVGTNNPRILIHGSNFITSGLDVSRVGIDGYLYDIDQEFQLSSQLIFRIPNVYTEHPGVYNIQVHNGNNGGGDSNIVPITIVQSAEITNIFPPSGTVGSSSFHITISGTDFPDSSIVRVRQSNVVTNITTSVVSATQLKAIIPLVQSFLYISVYDPVTPAKSSNEVFFYVPSSQASAQSSTSNNTNNQTLTPSNQTTTPTATPQSQVATPITPNATGQPPTGASASTTPTTTPTTNASPVTFGQTSNSIKNLQVFLNTHGFVIATTGAGSPGNETNYFGPLTRNALQNFQAANGLPRTSPSSGMFGPWTRSIILGRYGVSL